MKQKMKASQRHLKPVNTSRNRGRQREKEKEREGKRYIQREKGRELVQREIEIKQRKL